MIPEPSHQATPPPPAFRPHSPHCAEQRGAVPTEQIREQKKMSKCCFNLRSLGGLQHSNPRLEPAGVAAGLRAGPTRNRGALLLAVQPQAACLTPQRPLFLANETGMILTSVHLTELS